MNGDLAIRVAAFQANVVNPVGDIGAVELGREADRLTGIGRGERHREVVPVRVRRIGGHRQDQDGRSIHQHRERGCGLAIPGLHLALAADGVAMACDQAAHLL